uniref:Uncharacterized protein n=1 Tax=Meloidogyne enterolobii TaxID=390850 RepID=A0A6V7XIY1_MELEN|nr:unnamed protein product [Meloidogyne enterolobii]
MQCRRIWKRKQCRTQRHYVLPRTLKNRYLNKIQNQKLFKVGLIQYGLYRTYGGKILQDGHKIGDYNIRNLTVIEMVS